MAETQLKRPSPACAISEARLDVEAVLREAEEPEAGAELSRNTGAADERGVFGVPTFLVGDEMFWGQDRLDFFGRAVEASDTT